MLKYLMIWRKTLRVMAARLIALYSHPSLFPFSFFLYPFSFFLTRNCFSKLPPFPFQLLCQLREQILRELGFRDIFKKVKVRLSLCLSAEIIYIFLFDATKGTSIHALQLTPFSLNGRNNDMLINSIHNRMKKMPRRYLYLRMLSAIMMLSRTKLHASKI